MLQDVIHPPEQLPIEGLSSPISAQMFDFGDPDIYPETLQRNTEISSCSNYCYEDTSYPSDLSFSSFSSPFNNNNNLSLLLDDSTTPDNENEIEISALVNFPPHATFSVPRYPATQQEQFDIALLQSQIPLTDVSVNGFSPYSPDSIVPLSAQALPSVFKDDCLSPLSSFCLEQSGPPCSFIDPGFTSFLPGNLNSGISPEITGMFNGSLITGSESGLQSQELEFHGESGGIYSPDSMPQIYSSSDIQGLSVSDTQQLVMGCGSPTLTSEMTTLEESTFKVGRLSVEERKEKIHRYMKKRNERNFTKKIKYACRKTLADSRPRVRGRFAKNDDFGESTRPSCSNHEDEEDEEGRVKEEEEMVDSSDIFAHISGVNSFKCNFPLQSWI